MTNTELGAATNIMLGSTQAEAVYIGNTLMWQATQQIEDTSYISNPNVENGYHVYVNKNFHFDSTHSYKIEAKFKWLNNTTNQDQSAAHIVAIGKYARSIDVNGYRIYWHSSNRIYTNGLGVSYSNKGASTDLCTVSDIITGLTNEYYLTLFSNIRAYNRTMTNSEIYYVKITDTTTNTVVCNLIPKYNATRNIYFFRDTTDDTDYYLETLSPNMRESSDLTTYANE